MATGATTAICLPSHPSTACGESAGDYIGMGWPDRKDMLQWISWIIQRDPEARIVLHTASLICTLRAGYSFAEASSLEQVKKAKMPILYIHGEKDNFVHTEMVYPLYEACPTQKRLLVVEGAGHGSSYIMDP